MKALVVLASFWVLVSANFNPQQYAAPRSQTPDSNPNMSIQQQASTPNHNQQHHQSPFIPNTPTFLNNESKSDRIGGYGPPPNLFGNPSSGYPGGSSSFGLGPGGLGGGGGSAPVIHKHVYVHVPPPEPQVPRLRRPTSPPPPPQKHYKIIFIKAPTPEPPPEIEIPQMPQTETKTLVYVLVKKPEPAPAIRIPTPPPTKPSKPEVYFIRYNTPGGAANAAASLGISGANLPGVDFAPGGGDLGTNTISTDFGAAGQQEYGAPSF